MLEGCKENKQERAEKDSIYGIYVSRGGMLAVRCSFRVQKATSLLMERLHIV